MHSNRRIDSIAVPSTYNTFNMQPLAPIRLLNSQLSKQNSINDVMHKTTAIIVDQKFGTTTRLFVLEPVGSDCIPGCLRDTDFEQPTQGILFITSKVLRYIRRNMCFGSQ